MIFSLLVLVSSCSTYRFPGVHRITIQQGNVVNQAMIDKLRPGMTMSQVRFVLGNPVLEDPLNQSRWDYVSTVQIAGGETLRRKLVLHFRADRLSHFEGGFIPTSNKAVITGAMAD